MIKVEDASLLHFIEHFPDEDSCKSHIKEVRPKEGIICKKCQSEKRYWLKSKWMWNALIVVLETLIEYDLQ